MGRKRKNALFIHVEEEKGGKKYLLLRVARETREELITAF